MLNKIIYKLTETISLVVRENIANRLSSDIIFQLEDEHVKSRSIHDILHVPSNGERKPGWQRTIIGNLKVQFNV